MAKIPIRMPKMSMTMTEGEVSEWFVQPGDAIAEGDVVCEVLTDKVDMEVESPASGVLTSIEVETGTVDVGVPIGWLEGEDEGGLGDLLVPTQSEQPADSEQPAATTETDHPSAHASTTAESDAGPSHVAQPTADTTADGPVPAVPRARGLAREHGVDLGEIVGSGPDGLVLTSDVEERVAASADVATPVTARTTAATGQATAAATAAAAPSSASAGPSATRAPSSKRAALVRARVAAKMTESASVPQFTLWRDLELNAADVGRDGLSWTTVLLRAYAGALRSVPKLLCRWEDGAAVASGPPSIGLAVDTPDGLLAPVLVAPDEADPHELDRALRELVATAQTGRIDASYLQTANGMLSNLGGLGVDRFQALVTPPQGSVLAVGTIRRRPVAVPDGIGTALGVTVGLTVDHRVADGADGARLLQSIAALLTPEDQR